MGTINIVGLGPSDENALTLEAIKIMNNGNLNFLRTEKHDSVKYFKDNNISYSTFDHYYEEGREFIEIYRKMADTLIELSKDKDINYFVPGSPLIAEKTVTILLEEKEDCNLVMGMSFIEPLIACVKRDPIDGLKIIDADNFSVTDFNINVDTIVTQVYNNRILSMLKVEMSEIYGDDYKIFLISNAGIKSKEKVLEIPIYMLDRDNEVDHQSSIYIPCVDKKVDKIYDFNDLVKVTKSLRGENGCPWDMEQTHESIRKDLLEEAYEVIEAINEEDYENLCEELGDLLFQIVFHSEIASEEGEFNFTQITTAICDKLIYRHPHVFMEDFDSQKTNIKENWDKLKYDKRNINTFSDKLLDIKGLPALMRSEKVIDKVVKIGFNWSEVSGVLDKVSEELNEVKEAISEIGTNEKDHLKEELGDLLFTCVNLAHYLGYEAELILNETTDKFIKRFKVMEDLASNRNLNFESLSLEVLDGLWDEAKEILNK